MNIFQILFLDAILIIFPVLVYTIYLSTNKSIALKTKKLYLRFTLISSFFLLYNYGMNDLKPIPLLVLSSIIIAAYLEDLYVFANVLVLVLIIIYNQYFNNIFFLVIGYFSILLMYLFKKKSKISDAKFIEICSLINSLSYFIWIYLFNNNYIGFKVLFAVIIGYLFVINIMGLMYETGKKIIQTHMTFKDLQQEKQIRLSLFKITHEIKNPIAVCKSYLDMMNLDDSKQIKRYIPIIKSEIERLLTILQDFLLINKNNLDLDIMDFNMLIEETINKLDPLIKESNIKLKLNISDDEAFINGDYNRLSQVLINIIKNSIEAIPENKIGIINVKSNIKNNNYYLSIKDNGVGMDKEIMSKIKEPFYTTKRRGSGLGVSLIYEIIEAHNGEVEYTSEYGKGTKVTIKIPMYE